MALCSLAHNPANQQAVAAAPPAATPPAQGEHEGAAPDACARPPVHVEHVCKPNRLHQAWALEEESVKGERRSGIGRRGVYRGRAPKRPVRTGREQNREGEQAGAKQLAARFNSREMDQRLERGC